MAKSAALARFPFVAFCAMLVHNVVHAADPDPLADFSVPDLSSTAPLVSGYPCILRSKVTANDFVQLASEQQATFNSSLSHEVEKTCQAPTGAVAALSGPQEWPGLNTQSVTHTRLDFAIGGVIPLHTHPGLLFTSNQIFEPNITSAVVEKSFGIDSATAKLLEALYRGHP